jgi:hypothetical protein
MTHKTRRLVERLRGHGEISQDGIVVARDVRYCIDIFQRESDRVDGRNENGHRDVSGRIEAGTAVFREGMHTLTTTDGRALNFYFANLAGNIVNAGGGTM